jgi:hypothetical protein
MRAMKDIAVKHSEAEVKKNKVSKKNEDKEKSLTGPGLNRKKSSRVSVGKY